MLLKGGFEPFGLWRRPHARPCRAERGADHSNLPNEDESVSEWMGNLIGKADASARSCFCVGPQNGQPKCPCMMAAESDRDREFRRLQRENAELKRKLSESQPLAEQPK